MSIVKKVTFEIQSRKLVMTFKFINWSYGQR